MVKDYMYTLREILVEDCQAYHYDLRQLRRA